MTTHVTPKPTEGSSAKVFASRERFVDIGALDAVPLNGARVVKTVGGCIAVFRTADTSVFAVDDRCPHQGGPLSQGIVHGHSVTCPLHNWVIALDSGSARGPDHGAVRTYKLKVERGRILLDRSALTSKSAA